jgi:hypothetical protein
MTFRRRRRRPPLFVPLPLLVLAAFEKRLQRSGCLTDSELKIGN